MLIRVAGSLVDFRPAAGRLGGRLQSENIAAENSVVHKGGDVVVLAVPHCWNCLLRRAIDQRHAMSIQLN